MASSFGSFDFRPVTCRDAGFAGAIGLKEDSL